MEKYDYIIIGGGVAGLSALHKLLKQDKKTLLLEKDTSCGGLVKSSHKDDFLLEVGPTAFLKSYKQTMEFVTELGLTDEMIFNTPGADHRFIYKNDRIISVPEGPFAFISSPLLSLKCKMRLMIEPFIGRAKKEEESVYEFGKRRFGEEVSVNIMDAMVNGICAGDFKKLDIFSLFPKIGLIEKKFRSFLIFLLIFKLKSIEKNEDKKNVTFRTLRGGMGRIAQKAEELYSDHIISNAQVAQIIEEDGIFKITTEKGDSFLADKIVLATPANVASKLLESTLPKLGHELSKIPYGSITTCLMGYNKKAIKHPMNGFGFLISRNQNVRILGGLFASGLFEKRSPENTAAIKVYIGGTQDEEVQSLPESEIINTVEKELAPILDISEKPIFSHVNKIENGIPQYNLGHQEIKKNIYNELSKTNKVFLVGNYLDGISVNEAIKSSDRILDSF